MDERSITFKKKVEMNMLLRCLKDGWNVRKHNEEYVIYKPMKYITETNVVDNNLLYLKTWIKKYILEE